MMNTEAPSVFRLLDQMDLAVGLIDARIALAIQDANVSSIWTEIAQWQKDTGLSTGELAERAAPASFMASSRIVGSPLNHAKPPLVTPLT